MVGHQTPTFLHRVQRHYDSGRAHLLWVVQKRGPTSLQLPQ